jgi:Domain of unknown function (DUF4268)
VNTIIALGRFSQVALTAAWPTEDGNFTPWLSEPVNIALLGDALGMELEVMESESWVGSFRADILARVAEEGSELEHLVIIENQYGRTDHRHLGQILTYLAGVEGARTIVWIAERIQPDHRAAIDWLNTHTDGDFSFFAIEMELWQIDQSPPAPRFNVIASPNEWTRRTRAVARRLNEDELSGATSTRVAYWASFGEFLTNNNAPFRIRRANKRHWFNFPIGRSGFWIAALISTEHQWIRVGLNMRRDADKAAFDTLFSQKDQIEAEFAESLDWQRLPGKMASRIVIYRYNSDLSVQEQWDELHGWMLSKMERFRSVFAERVRHLPISTGPGAPSDEDEPSEE